ncbi:unnamed protein product [Rangifer tarandus platyrhynchus]|uniref:Uncharacterized protein n=1 Tax=Rangifer tarandus platyrhynchus TaxID=3082113 RepID=A0AC60A284_RANTA
MYGRGPCHPMPSAAMPVTTVTPAAQRTSDPEGTRTTAGREPPPTAEPFISTHRPPRLRSPSGPLRSSSVSMREWSVKVPDPRGSKASTPTREGLAEAWPKPCSLGPRNPVVGQRDPGSERPPPLGGRDEGEVCCGFQWVAVVRALRPRKTEPKLSECAPSSPTHRGPGPGAPGSPARRRCRPGPQFTCPPEARGPGGPPG